MRIYPLSCILLLCSLFSGVAQSQVQKIYVHPKAPGNAKQSEFVDSIRFIPLEIKEGIQFGAYNTIQVSDKYFLITDYPNKVLLLYSKDGSFIKKINFRKLDANSYPAYKEETNQVVFLGGNKNYALTPKDELLIKLDWNNPRNKKYFKKYVIDLNDTSFKFRKDIATENDIAESSLLYDDVYGQGQIITSSLYKDSMDYEFKIYRDHRMVKGFFPYNHINESRFLYTEEETESSETDTPYIHFITRPFCDTIYKMVKDSLFPAYQLVLPLENSLPASFFTKPFKNKTERENFNRNNGWMLHQIYGFYETNRLIFFSVGYFTNYDFYVYDKKSRATFRAKNIKPDSSQYNLQLLADYRMIRQGNKFYKMQKASDLIAFFEQNKNLPVPNELENFLKTKPAGDTPVIVEFKLKNEL